MRHAAWALLLAAAARADDGGLAPDTRWNHARGPASGSGMSVAEPPESFGRIAWTCRANRAILATPVVWDGAIFVVDGDASAAEIVALDAETGKAWARAEARAPGQPAAYARNAFVVEEGRTVAQFRLAGRTLSREWTYEAGPGASAPRVVDGEIYVTTPGALLSLRAGASKPAWKVDGAFTGEPAARGGDVYALRRDDTGLLLCAYARADGKESGSLRLCDAAPAAAGGRIALGEMIAAVLLPPEQERAWAIVSRTPGPDGPRLELKRTEKLLLDPLATHHIVVGLSAEPQAWSLFYLDDKQPRLARVGAKERPELFESPGAPIWLGESCQVYGDWCGDMVSNVIYWHARERPEGAALRKGLRFGAVPARDRLLLLVPKDGASILALAPEELK